MLGFALSLSEIPTVQQTPVIADCVSTSEQRPSSWSVSLCTRRASAFKTSDAPCHTSGSAMALWPTLPAGLLLDNHVLTSLPSGPAALLPTAETRLSVHTREHPGASQWCGAQQPSQACGMSAERSPHRRPTREPREPGGLKHTEVRTSQVSL